MAIYYWVGGAGTWDNASTTHWATSSGGAGGAGVPTSADNVIFDTASGTVAYAVTIGVTATPANCNDVTIGGLAAAAVTITSTATSVLNVYGSWTNAATQVAFASTAGSNLNFLATTTGKTITTNNLTLGLLTLNFNGVSGGWTLGSAFTSTAAFNFNQGTFSTANFAVSVAGLNSSGTSTRSVSLGSSTVTCSGATPVNIVNATGLTFNAGTSTITCTSATSSFTGGGLTYYNVSFTSNGANASTIINGNNTFNNLSQTSPAGGRRTITLGANQIIAGTLTLGVANAYNQRIQVVSGGAGNPVTLTVATIATLSDVDFRDITAAGASGTWSGTRIGNGLGNSNITFAAGKTVYWNLVAGGNWGTSTAWATSSGGTPATANFPLSQDTAIIDNTGLTTGNTITTEAAWWVSTVNSTRTNAWNYVSTAGLTVYGDFTIPSVTTVSGTSPLLFQGQGLTQALTTNGVAFTMGFIVVSIGGTLVLNGALTLGATNVFTLSNGTLNLNNYTLTCGLFSSSGTGVRTIVFGTGKIVVSGNAGTIWNTDGATNFTYTGTGRVELSYSGATGTRAIYHGLSNGTETNSPNFYVIAGTDIVSFIGAGRKFGTIDFTGFGTGTGTIGGTQTVYGNLVLVSGMTIPSQTTGITFGSTSGTKTITTAGKTLDFPVTFDGIGGTWSCSDALTLGATRALTLTNGTLKLKSGVTSTVGSFVTSGTNIKYLQSTTPGVQATISDVSGTNTVTYLTIRDSSAAGGATWNALASTNINGGNNTGWLLFSSNAVYMGGYPSFVDKYGVTITKYGVVPSV
jgi:hypothetical protein